LKKSKYRIRNWRDYNEALVNRGSLTFWFDEETINSWHETQRSGRRGAPRWYCDVAIQCSLTLGDGNCQGICRLDGITHAAFFKGSPLSAFVNEVARFFHATFLCADSLGFDSFGGFSQTSWAGSQFRVLPDQRSGCRALAIA
jgi:hypothetical protein